MRQNLEKKNTQLTPSLPPVADWLTGSDRERGGAWHECDSWHRMLY